MQSVDKFKSDLDRALDRGGDQGASLRKFLDGYFPFVPAETRAALFSDAGERLRRDPAAAKAWAAGLGSILLKDYDGSPLSAQDWRGLGQAASAGSGELDMELLSYIMDLVLENHAL